MAERTRERGPSDLMYHEPNDILEDIPRTSGNIDPDVAMPQYAPEVPATQTAVKDGLSRADAFTTPKWLDGHLPIEWSGADMCRKTNIRPGRNCCLFAPLSYCDRSMDVINGFCTFHLRSLFNLTLQNDALYQLNAKGTAVVWYRKQCFVMDPRPCDDRITACFPLFELYDRPPTVNDIKLHNLERYLVSINAANWEKTYAMHVNFLHRLITIYNNYATPRRLTREEQQFNNQLIMHFNLWNEYHSWVLKKMPAELYMFHMSNEDDNVRGVPLSKCTTITQMIARLFSESYTRLDDNRFLSGPTTYGVWIKGHVSYSDNLCSFGTTTTANNTSTIGALATFPLLRTDSCKESLIHHTLGVNCQESFSINAKVDHENKELNKSVLVSGDMNK